MKSAMRHLISIRSLETVAVLLLLSVMSARAAWAKKVSINWAPLPGAAQYEIEIQRDGKTVAQKKLEDSSWHGDLKFGVYVYQIRAYDRVKRPGEWTDPMPLVVMPAPPEPKGPADGKNLVHFDPAAGTTLRWEPVNGASQYRIELSHDGKPMASHTVSNPSLTIKALPPGEYSWKVIAIVKPKGRLPASFEARQWESKASETSRFRIDHQRLDRPSISYPVGSVFPPADGQVKFKWKSVDGAEAYELEVFAKDMAKDTKGRSPSAFEPKALAHLIASDNSAVVKLPSQGQYTWKVRALANIDEQKTPEAVGPQSVSDFKLDKNASFVDGGGYVAVSAMFAPYSYQVISPASGFNGTGASVAQTVRVSGEYWFKPQWGLGAAGESTLFGLSGENYNRLGYELVGKYRYCFGGGRYSWTLAPKMGIEERDYIEVFPPDISVAAKTLRAYGPQLGLDLRKQFSERFSLGVKVAYFVPLYISAIGVDGLTSDASYRNISVGAQCLYWLNHRWGLGAGLYTEKRSISFGVQGAPAGTAPEQIFMDGTYFFGSLIYSFGR